jgi:hypothetical protein
VVVDVMAAVQRAGITSMGMITNPQPERIRSKGAAEAPGR